MNPGMSSLKRLGTETSLVFKSSSSIIYNLFKLGKLLAGGGMSPQNYSTSTFVVLSGFGPPRADSNAIVFASLSKGQS
jgi:hypothetical protein